MDWFVLYIVNHPFFKFKHANDFIVFLRIANTDLSLQLKEATGQSSTNTSKNHLSSPLKALFYCPHF